MVTDRSTVVTNYRGRKEMQVRAGGQILMPEVAASGTGRCKWGTALSIGVASSLAGI